MRIAAVTSAVDSMPEANHYRTLNIPPGATADEIQRSYRTLARRYHPDLNSQPSAARAMAAINAAYEILGEPSRRAAYDRTHTRTHFALDDAILSAAHDQLLRERWSVVQDKENALVLRTGSRIAQVLLTRLVKMSFIQPTLQRASGLLVILAANIEPEFRLTKEPVVVIDLVRSVIVHGKFPDATYRELFTHFILH